MLNSTFENSILFLIYVLVLKILQFFARLYNVYNIFVFLAVQANLEKAFFFYILKFLSL